MAMEWLFDNGFLLIAFIFSCVDILATIIGLPLIIMQIIDMDRKWKKDKAVGPQISFFDCRARHSTTTGGYSTFKLVFSVRNEGDSRTTVYVTKYTISTTVNSQLYSETEKVQKPDRIKIGILEETEKHIIAKLPEAAKEWTNAKLILEYSYIDLTKALIKTTTGELDVSRYD